MNKKSVLSTIVGIAILLLLLIAILMLFAPEEALRKAANFFGNMADKYFVGTANAEIKKTEIIIDKEIEKTYESILKVLRTQGTEPCIDYYEPLAESLKDYKIVLTKTDKDTISQLLDKNNQVLKTNTISGRMPCIVGFGTSAQNFFDNYLSGTICTASKSCKKDYTIVDTIELKSKTKYLYVTKDTSTKPQEINHNDRNMVYKKDGNICFYSTVGDISIIVKDKCDKWKDKIDDDCFKKENYVTIPNLIKNNQIRVCSQPIAGEI